MNPNRPARCALCLDVACYHEACRETPNKAVQIISAVFEVIKATGEAGIPSGVLYASLMPYGCTMEQYRDIIEALKDAGFVTERAYVLRVA